MLVKVSRLEKNPHRDLVNYPIAQSEIDKKKSSINKTGFWDTILGRPHPEKEGYFQLAFGHTRIEAVKQLGIKEVDIPIKDISDENMLLIMADENKENDDDPSRVNETVAETRKYLNNQFKKYDYDYKKIPENLKSLLKKIDFNSLTGKEITNAKIALSNIKTKGVGTPIISAFLVDWSETMIQESLATLRDAEDQTDEKTGKVKKASIDIKAVETFPNTHRATAFRQAVKTYGVPKERQKALAKKIIENPDIDSATSVKKAVQNEVTENKKKSKALTKTDKHKIERDAELEELKELIEETAKSINSTNSKITRLLSKLNEMKVSSLSGLEITENDIYCGILVDTLIEFSTYLSFNISKEDK